MRISTVRRCAIQAVCALTLVAIGAIQPAAAQSADAAVPDFITKDMTAWADHPWAKLPPLRATKIHTHLQRSKKQWSEIDIMPVRNTGGVTLARESARTWSNYKSATYRSFLGFFRLSGNVDSNRFNRFQDARRFTNLKRLKVPAGTPKIDGVDPADLAVSFIFETLFSGSQVRTIVDTHVLGHGPREVSVNGEMLTLDCYTLSHRMRGYVSTGYSKTLDVGYCPQLGYFTAYQWEVLADEVESIAVTLKYEVTPERFAELKAGK